MKQMKLFGWIRSKILGGESNGVEKSPSKIPSLIDSGDTQTQESSNEEFIDHYPKGILAIGTLGDLTPQEMGSLQKELVSLFTKQQDLSRKTLAEFSEDPNTNSGSNKVVIVKKKSMSFLLKKIFVCGGGFSPVLGRLRDPPPEPRIGQILRGILYKKIYPHRSSSSPTPSSPKKYIEDRHLVELRDEISDEETDGEVKGSKWDKTDSEYIVLEI